MTTKTLSIIINANMVNKKEFILMTLSFDAKTFMIKNYILRSYNKKLQFLKK